MAFIGARSLPSEEADFNNSESYAKGMRAVNVLPAHNWLETVMLPPSASTIALQMASPRRVRPSAAIRDLSAR